jgi:hypothetical protein
MRREVRVVRGSVCDLRGTQHYAPCITVGRIIAMHRSAGTGFGWRAVLFVCMKDRHIDAVVIWQRGGRKGQADVGGSSSYSHNIGISPHFLLPQMWADSLALPSMPATGNANKSLKGVP